MHVDAGARRRGVPADQLQGRLMQGGSGAGPIGFEKLAAFV